MGKPKSESTAINELISLVAKQRSALPATVEPLPRARAPQGTRPLPAHAVVDMTDQSWFQDSQALDRVAVDEADLGTMVVPRPTNPRRVLARVALPAGVLIALGLGVGGYVFFRAEHGARRSAATAPVAAAVVAAPPVATPVVASAPVFVDVRVDSRPAGATAVLVDRGKSTFLGTTPLTTALDPTRVYELVFTLENGSTQRAQLDPTTTRRVAVALDPGDANEARRPARPAVNGRGEGTLMVSSKPPCEIHIDGRPTGLMTPQRALPLPAGTHELTLVNTALSIDKTVRVKITADRATKVIQDLMP